MAALVCQEEGGAEFSIRPSPAVSIGFHECGHYRLSLEHEGMCNLVVDDVALPCARDGTRHHWDWEPGFYAGTVVAELLDEQGVQVACYRLDVAPDPSKLGHDFFQRMVNELQATDPELVFGAEAAQHAIGNSGHFANVHLAHARLKLFGHQYLLALKQVAGSPLTVLLSERRLEPAHRVRRIDHRTLTGIIKNPVAVAALRGEGTSNPDRLLFDVPASREDLDTPAHRILLAVLVSIIQRIRSVRAGLTKLGNGDRLGQVRAPMRPRLPLREKLLDDLEAGLKALSRARPFSDVTRREVSSAGLNVISGHPAYARAFRLGWQILRPGIGGENSGELLPVSPTWEIYERWCFFRVVEALRQIYPDLAWSRKNGSLADRVMFAGEGDGIQVQAQLQASFPAIDKKPDGKPFYSISAERQPDIVVTWSSGTRRRFVVFDAKYRVSRHNVLKAMASAHIYRDCLRWNAIRPDYAMLLIPAGGGAVELEKSCFHAEHGVGVIPLSPATELAQISSFLSGLLLDAKSSNSPAAAEK